MEFFMLPLLAIWTFIAVIIGRYAGRRTGRRWVKWTVLLCIWFLPWTDVFIGSVLAQWRLFQLGTVAEQVSAPGFLAGLNRNFSSPFYLDYLRPEEGYEYIEVEYTRRVSGTPSDQHGPGYYQFRLSTIDQATCRAMKVEEIPPHIYRQQGYASCFEFSRTDALISRYSYTFREEEPTPLERRFKVSVTCQRVTDLQREQDIARNCRAGIKSWMFDGGFMSFPLFRAAHNVRFKIQDVIRPVR